MRPLRVAIVGLGEFGKLHLDVLRDLRGVEIAALVSRSRSHASELAQRYGVPRVYGSTAELVAAEALDAVHVVTEDSRHLEPVMTALAAGIDVFVEKPLSHDMAEAHAMVAEAERLGRRLMVGHILRFDAGSAAIKARIERGDLGRVVSVFGRRNMCRTFLDQYSHSNRLFTTGVHDIDLILWYMAGRRPVEVFMKSASVMGKGDDLFWGCITFEDGSVGIVESLWLLPDATPWRGHVSMEVIGTLGAAHSEVPGGGLSFWYDDRIEVPDTQYWPAVHGAVQGALRTELGYFLRCVEHGLPIEIPYPHEAIAGLEIAHALIRSAAEGRAVAL